MRRHRHRSHSDSSGLIGRLVKITCVAALIIGVGGLTWLVLTPVDAPTQEVVREVSNDHLAAP